MKLELRYTKRFKKDLALAKRRGKDLEKLWKVAQFLLDREPLLSKHRPHRLIGGWDSYWECHIEPDWLLIYRYISPYLELSRTGTHADLFE